MQLGTCICCGEKLAVYKHQDGEFCRVCFEFHLWGVMLDRTSPMALE